MGRILVLWCALSISCSSEKSDRPAAAPVPTEVAPAAPLVADPAPSPQQLERDAKAVQCRRADVEACATAATLSTGLGDEAGATQYRELGCLHGSAAACLARQTGDAGNHWVGAACRRGDKEACRRAPAARAYEYRLTAPTEGPVGARIQTTYAASIEDCAVRHEASAGTFKASFSVREGHTAGIAIAPASGDFAACMRAAIEQWVFLEPGADGGPHEVSARFQSARHAAEARLEEEAATAIVEVLVAGEEDDDSVVHMRDRRPGADLDSDLADAIAEIKDSNRNVAVGGDLDVGVRTGDVRGSAQGTTLGPGDTAKKIDGPSLRIAISDVQLADPSSLESTEVTANVRRRYLAGLLRCYKQRLKQDPEYAGTVRLSFTIQGSGRAANVRAEATPPADDLAVCVRGMVGSWRFPIPRDEDGDPTDVDASVALRFSS